MSERRSGRVGFPRRKLGTRSSKTITALVRGRGSDGRSSRDRKKRAHADGTQEELEQKKRGVSPKRRRGKQKKTRSTKGSRRPKRKGGATVFSGSPSLCVGQRSHSPEDPSISSRVELSPSTEIERGVGRGRPVRNNSFQVAIRLRHGCPGPGNALQRRGRRTCTQNGTPNEWGSPPYVRQTLRGRGIRQPCSSAVGMRKAQLAAARLIKTRGIG